MGFTRPVGGVLEELVIPAVTLPMAWCNWRVGKGVLHRKFTDPCWGHCETGKVVEASGSATQLHAAFRV